MRIGIILSFIFIVTTSVAQSYALVLNGAFVVLDGGTPAVPIYIVVDQSSFLGISRTSGHIISEGDYNFVKWNTSSSTGPYVYPFGFSTTDYIPFTFEKISGNNNFSASTNTSVTANTPLANGVTDMIPSGPASDASNMVVDRWWRLQCENCVTAPVSNLTFSYRGSENTIAGISCPAEDIASQYWTGTAWAGPALAPGTPCVTSGIGTSLASTVPAAVFSGAVSRPFVLVKKTNILPVELLNFSARCNSEKVNLNWATATEDNNDFFTIDRSADAVNYQTLGFINGAGNSTTIKNYSFVDNDPLKGASYYRLRQTDFNGMSQVFPPVITNCTNGGFAVVVGQEGFGSGNFWVSVTGVGLEPVSLSVTNILGQRIYSNDLSGSNGDYLVKENMQLAPGVYIVTASTKAEFFSDKILVVR